MHNSRILSSVIESIERFNRPYMWRLIEYVVFFFQALSNRYKITNYSIGRYQLKVNYILDHHHIEYEMVNKIISFETKMSISSIIHIILASNQEEVLINLICMKFSDFNIDALSEDELKAIFLFYSRNIEFDEGPNYYTFGKKLYAEGVNNHIT